MAFSEIELKKIEKFIGGLCQQKTPEEYKNELRFEYKIKAHDVTIYEIRPAWDDPRKTIEMGIAKLKFIGTKKVWNLYWKRASGKWELYGPAKDNNDLASLIGVIQQDVNCCFFG